MQCTYSVVKKLHAFRRKGLSLFDKCINMKNVHVDERPENEIDEVDDVHVSIRNVCTVINTKIRQQAKSIMQMQCTEPLDMTTFNINNMISKIDPALFKMVVLLIQRLREYRQDANTEEVDTHIWLHASKFTGQKILILSPDIDVYHIGLSQSTHNDIIIQLNCIGRAIQMVSMKAFVMHCAQIQT